MGPVAVVDRFRQIAPKVLFATDGYRYGGKVFDRRAVLAAIRAAAADAHSCSIRDACVDARSLARDAVDGSKAIAGDAPLRTEQVASDHPLWVVYSSGTTGMPKAIVHGHGGLAARDAEGVGLHRDIGPGDRFHWYTSDRLDHVERADERTARGRDGRAVRRQPRLSGPRCAVALRRARGCDVLRQPAPRSTRTA